MESAIAQHLNPEFEPVAVVWSNSIPEASIQFKKGKFGCTLNLFAEASRNRKVAGGNRETIVCSGGRAALGLGVKFDSTDEMLDRYAAVFSKGIKSATNQAAFRARMDAVPKSWRPMYEYGERRHGNPDLAREWMLHGLPRYDISYEYVLFKPLSLTGAEENVRAVIFPVNPTELTGLVMLAGSVMPGTDPVQVPQGPACISLAAFVYAQNESANPRAVLGMLDVDGRRMMHRRFRDDTLTLALPIPLYKRMEEEAEDCVMQTPAWSKLTSE